MLRPNAQDRLTAAEALAHSWIKAAHSCAGAESSTRRSTLKRPTHVRADEQLILEEQAAERARNVSYSTVNSLAIIQRNPVNISDPGDGESRSQIADSTHPAIASVATTPLPLSFLSSDQSSLPPLGIEPKMQRFLDHWRTLGEKNQDTLSSMQNLALAYLGLREYEEARQLFHKTLEVRKRVLGEEHVDTLDTSYWLAMSCYNLKRYNEAREMFQKTLEGHKRVLGEEHVDTLKTSYWFAETCYCVKQYDEAQRLHQKTYKARMRVLGRDHPDTLDYKKMLEIN
jgi:tetratricopeptide (TPR) repeat protein